MTKLKCPKCGLEFEAPRDRPITLEYNITCPRCKAWGWAKYWWVGKEELLRRLEETEGLI